MNIPVPHLAVIPVGAAVLLEMEITNVGPADPWSDAPRFDPNGGVTVTVTKPDGTATGVTNVPMTRIETGVYQYTYQTQVGDQTGLYNVEVIATHLTQAQKGQLYGAFRVVP